MESQSEPPKKVSKHLRRFFLGWHNPCAQELILFIVFSFTISFLTVGFVILSRNNRGFVYQFDYTDFCGNQSVCALPPFSVPADAPTPLYLRYRIDSFFHNHYKFWKSVPLNQFVNNETGRGSNEGCDIYTTNAQMNKTTSVTGLPLNPSDVAIPCGVMAFTYFNDHFTLTDSGTLQQLPVASSGIAWSSDKYYKYVNVDLNRQWINVQDERFISWMRVSPYNHFVKTWGVVDESVRGKRIVVTVANNWNAQKTRSRKQLILTSADFYGTPNSALVVFLLLFGFLALLLGILLCAQWFRTTRDRFHLREEPSASTSESYVLTDSEHPPS
jgi:hypothetical protein